MNRSIINKKRELIAASILTVIMAAMDITGFPSALFVNVQFADVTPMYFTLMANFVLTGLVCFLGIKIFCPDWHLGLQTEGLISGLRRYAPAGIAALACTFMGFYIGLQPFDYTPTVWKVLIEGFVYYIGVGIIEELYVRGLLLNIIEKLFGKRKSAAFWAVIISSVVFGVGHIFTAIGSPAWMIVCKVVSTFGLGVYFGAVYKKTNCLWVAVILHTVIDFCGVPFCFSTASVYPEVSMYVILVVYTLLGIYGVNIMIKNHNDFAVNTD